MRMIPPRLNHLLRILMRASRPVSVNDLAKQLDVSRRTVFRELENIDVLLRPYALRVGTKAGEGIYLDGGSESMESLRGELNAMGAVEPSGRQERRIFLALDLLTDCDQQKLYYYADRFKVSEATISHDLDAVEKLLKKHSLTLVRKPGYGVSIEGGEAGIRGAICAVLSEIKRSDRQFHAALNYPPEEIAGGVRQLMQTRFAPHLAWITEESKDALELFMAVSVERIFTHNTLPETAKEAQSRFLTMADILANSLELKFSIIFSEWERENLARYLSACRLAAGTYAKIGEASSEYRLKRFAYQLIEQFDPELSPLLKLDDQLVEGLASHLQSAVVRIENCVELDDPLLREISRVYPEILEKCKHALKALEEISSDVPDSEAGFLATHFGAAVMRLRENGARRRSLRVGVVCAGGIGTSYLMASQIKRHFGSQAEIEISGLGDIEDWSRFDLLVTSMPVAGVEVPTIQVSPLLEEADVEAIRLQIDKCASEQRQAVPRAGKEPLSVQCERIGGILSDVREILIHFDTVSIESNSDFDRLAKLAGYRFGGLPESGRLIYEDLIKRESVSTQVVPSLELILLHARTLGVQSPVFSLIVPENGRFTDPSLKNSRCCVVMLVPQEASRNRLELMGRISSALLEDNEFLTSVLEGDKNSAYRCLEENFRDYLSNNINF